ncbi:MAG: tRNA guanosine(34) transglycosylase Tgt, partial [Thermoguttaceae bacterium]|nr:tRNA guanosine(34) transglycosylase Tgt [Thermoguttaceae bacterium]
LSIHNITYYQRLVSRARDAIVNGTWKEFRKERLAGWGFEPFEEN